MKETLVDGDDDAGTDRNALVAHRAEAGRTYRLKVRLYHADDSGETLVMYWAS